MSTYEHVGYVRYNAHPAAPLAIGDLQIMKGWKGDPDGGTGSKVIDIGTGKIWTGDLDITAPDVFVKGDSEVVLLAEMDRPNLLQSYTVDDLQEPLAAKFVGEPRVFEIEVPSGAIVVNIAYNATPEEGADTSELEDEAWFDDLPYLPKEAPKQPFYAKDGPPDARGLAIVPVKPGTYIVEQGDVEGGDEDGFMRLVLRRKA